ncbi:MAG: septum site-determining protein MinC [Candidatus Sericytochromatia bacterium]
MTNSVSIDETEQIDKITIKGNKEGLLIIIPEGNWLELLKQLSEILEKDKNFWIGAQASVDLGNHSLDEVQLNRFYEMLIKRHHLIISAIYSKDESTRVFAEKLNLKVGKVHPLMQKQPQNLVQEAPIAATSATNSSGGNATYLKQTLRSGQTVRFDGNVIVYGDTNPGSEIIASGDIIVIGTLRGIAHAGAKGDENCQIVSTNLKATQLRIGSVIGVAGDDKGSSTPVPECATVVDGKIYISPLKVKRTG